VIQRPTSKVKYEGEGMLMRDFFLQEYEKWKSTMTASQEQPGRCCGCCPWTFSEGVPKQGWKGLTQAMRSLKTLCNTY